MNEYININRIVNEKAVREKFDGIKLTGVANKGGITASYTIKLDWEEVDRGTTIKVDNPDLEIETGSLRVIEVEERVKEFKLLPKAITND